MTAKQVPTILATCCGDPEKQAAYQQAGCRVLCLEAHCGHVNLLQLMEQLGQEQIDSILLEGGGTFELVCTGKRHRAADTGLHCPEAVRRKGCQSTH